MANATDLLVEHIMGIAGTPLPPAAEQRARECLLDFIGVAFAGAQQNRDRLSGMFATNSGRCLVMGLGVSATSREAAFANAFDAHALELDDGSRFGMIHLGAAIVSAVIAAARERGSSLERVLTGIACGYEAAVRTSLAMQPGHKRRGFHTSGTCGTIGAAVGVACSLGCDAAQLKAAIACAATGAAGLLEIQEDASELKPYNVGHAALSGLNAAYTGMAGFCGPDDILSGSRGMLRLLSDDCDPGRLASPADPLEIERIYVKPYAACRHCHSAIEATLRLRDQGVRAQDVESIEVRTYELAVRGHDHTEVQGVASAKLSMPFSVAAALVLGSAGLEAFSPETVADERICSLARRVRVVADPQLTALRDRRAAEVHIITASAEYSERVDYAKGDPENPLSREELVGKFEGLMAWAGATELCEQIERRVLS